MPWSKVILLNLVMKSIRCDAAGERTGPDAARRFAPFVIIVR